MDRKDQYKTSGHNVTTQRSKRRDQEAEIRKEKREKLLSSKRVRFSEIENDCEVEDYTVEQVQELAKTIQKSDKNILNSLKSLRKAFALGSELISVFLAVDNSLRALVGHLTGNNAQLQLEAAWCITNLATGVHDDTMKVFSLPILLDKMCNFKINVPGLWATSLAILGSAETFCGLRGLLFRWSTF